MGFRSLTYSSAISALILCAYQPAAAQTVQTDGISVTVSGIVINQNSITVQFVVTNNRRARAYLTDARSDDSQKAFLGSGTHLNHPMIASFNSCNSSASQCIGNPNDMSDLNKFSYLEPGGSSTLGFEYSTQTQANDSDTISFSVALIARFAEVGGDQSHAGRPQPLQFGFPYIHLNRR